MPHPAEPTYDQDSASCHSYLPDPTEPSVQGSGGSVALFDINTASLYVTKSTQAGRYHVDLVRDIREVPQQAAHWDRFSYFAVEPGAENYNFFNIMHESFMATLPPLFKDVQDEFDEEEEDKTQETVSRPTTLTGFCGATNTTSKAIARLLAPSPKARELWFNTRGLNNPRSQCKPVKVSKTTNYYSGHPDAFMFRAPLPPPGFTLQHYDIPWDKFLVTSQNQIGAAAHALISCVLVLERLKMELSNMAVRLNSPDQNGSFDLEETFDLLNDASDLIDTSIGRKLGNSFRIMASIFNDYTDKRREMIGRVSRNGYQKAIEAKEVPPSEGNLFGAIAWDDYYQKNKDRLNLNSDQHQRFNRKAKRQNSNNSSYSSGKNNNKSGSQNRSGGKAHSFQGKGSRTTPYEKKSTGSSQPNKNQNQDKQGSDSKKKWNGPKKSKSQ